MIRVLLLLLLFSPLALFSQAAKEVSKESQDQDNSYKKRVLQNAEIDILTSLYTQDGDNAAVTGGIGTEKLTDFASNISIAVPLNEDDVLTIDATISAYSSASSGNLDPFGDRNKTDVSSPWVASSGASQNDEWKHGSLAYSHSSDDRNKIYGANIAVANEYDYTSFGAGLSFSRLFNDQNTEISIGANTFIDFWKPEYPIEIRSFVKQNGNLNSGFFNGLEILSSDGTAIDKSSNNAWSAINSTLIENKGRNTFSLSLSLSQILSSRFQLSLFSDLTYQTGWLGNPMQRVYFSDKDNFYVGNPANISSYTDKSNTDLFQLADDIERLPESRLKIPVGLRAHYYVNEYIILKSYYRYYFDDWGIHSNTINIEVPIKLGDIFTIYPSFRYYDQTAADYFAPFDEHLSSSDYYTSDHDLSAFNSKQYGMGLKYTNVYMEGKIWRFGLKNVSLNYSYYQRTTGLKAHIISLGAKVVFE